MNNKQKTSTNIKPLRSIASPNSSLKLEVGVNNSTVWYSLAKSDGQVLIDKSNLVILSHDKNLAAAESDIDFTESSHNETWEQPWGEQRFVQNNHNELAIRFQKSTIKFRLFDEGLGFRYELGGEGDIVITKELSEFNISKDSASAWWIPALGQNHYEHLYQNTSIDEIATAHTPLTIELGIKTYAAIHEAALYNYGSMNIVPTNSGLESAITPLQDGSAAHVNLPFNTPWRTIIFSDTAIGLSNSKIMLNLNEPSKIADTSWIKPIKFMGIWWGMFISHFTWSSGDKHGATTANAIRYINAARDLGIRGLLIEGWNETWDGDWTQNGDRMNHMQPYPDFDIRTIASYAKTQGVEIVGHHETSGNISHYEWELPEAYDYYRHFGVNYIKTGYVAPRLNTGDFHSSQVGVNHYQKTVELAAERKIMLDIHEPVKGTGIERTWPNLMTREGVMGQEYEGGAVSPEHATVLPFTRLLAGPLDYTPGLFNLSGTERKVQTTLAKQLAFYVTMFSPVQMAADLPEHYKDQSAFQFIADVPVNWDKSVPLDGVIGDYYVIARKDRHSDNWYVGGVTDEQERTVTISLDFLNDHQTYTATIYRDGDDASFHANQESHIIETKNVKNYDLLTVRMAPGGGFAISLKLDGQTAYPYPNT